MSVARRLFIHRLRELEIASDRGGTQVEEQTYGVGYLGVAHVHLRRAVSVDIQRDGLCYAYGVTHLHQHLMRHTGGYQMLRDPACGIRGRTVHFRGILSAERTAAVSTAAAVGIDDDLTARQTRVAVRTTDDEVTRRVH